MDSPFDFFQMNNIPTEKLGKSEWLTRTDIRKLEKMYKCKPKHERIKNLGKYLILIHKYLSNITKMQKSLKKIFVSVSDVGQLITGPFDVGGQCPSPTNKYTSRFGKPIYIYDKYLYKFMYIIN